MGQQPHFELIKRHAGTPANVIQVSGCAAASQWKAEYSGTWRPDWHRIYRYVGDAPRSQLFIGRGDSPLHLPTFLRPLFKTSSPDPLHED
jgi:hypothetical protein